VLIGLVTAIALTAPSDPIPPAPAPRYFFILFGGQSLPFKPNTAHTWGTFVKTMPDATGVIQAESITISWLPATGRVKPWKCRAEPGKNYSLDETFVIAAEQRDRVSMWGPFEIDASRYELAVAQAALLETGAVRYRAIDSFTRNLWVQHCVHAVTYADPLLKELVQPVLQVGEPGTSRLAERYLKSGAFVGGAITHDWVLTAIGADQYPVVRRYPGERIRREWREKNPRPLLSIRCRHGLRPPHHPTRFGRGPHLRSAWQQG
jgi:hypothetical protein